MSQVIKKSGGIPRSFEGGYFRLRARKSIVFFALGLAIFSIPAWAANGRWCSGGCKCIENFHFEGCVAHGDTRCVKSTSCPSSCSSSGKCLFLYNGTVKWWCEDTKNLSQGTKTCSGTTLVTTTVWDQRGCGTWSGGSNYASDHANDCDADDVGSAWGGCNKTGSQYSTVANKPNDSYCVCKSETTPCGMSRNQGGRTDCGTGTYCATGTCTGGACCATAAWTPASCPASCQQTRTQGCGGATTQPCTGGACVPTPVYAEVMKVKCPAPVGTVDIAGFETSATETSKMKVRKSGKTYFVSLVETTDTANGSCERVRIAGKTWALRKCVTSGGTSNCS